MPDGAELVQELLAEKLGVSRMPVYEALQQLEKFEKEFGPLIVSIDTEGRSVFEENKVVFNQRKDEAIAEICTQVSFIK